MCFQNDVEVGGDLDNDEEAEELQQQQALVSEERARKEAELRLAALDEERAREAARHAQEAAAAAAAATNPNPLVASADQTIKTFLKEKEVLKKEVEAAQGKLDDARRKGTPEEITEAGKILKAAKTKKRQHYNHAISRCAWPEVHISHI